MYFRNVLSTSLAGLLLGSLPIHASNILTTDGFSTCGDNTGDIVVQRFNVRYDRSSMNVSFDVAGESKISQKIWAELTVTAYGKQVYQRSFNPCDDSSKVDLLCPATGTLPIPAQYASQIPAIAFQVPDLDGIAKLTLHPIDNQSATLACLSSSVKNGKTAQQPAVTYVTAGVAAGALALSGASVIGAAFAGAGGGHAVSSSGPTPNVVDVVMWFQSIAVTGLLSVEYPPVYRAFTKNFAWSTGLISWDAMQRNIDGFRAKTGGNLTRSSVDELKNTTLIFTQDTATTSNATKRSLTYASELMKRLDIQTSVNGTVAGTTNTTVDNSGNQTKEMRFVKGIQAYVEQLLIPNANTFLTVLLVFCIALASTAVLILAFKLILELYAMCGKLSKPLQGFRKRYWEFLGGTLLRIILIVYGIWTIYCLYQFKNGDSWAALVLAAVTLSLFTAILAFFSVRIIVMAKRAKRLEGTPEKLFIDKKNLRRYGLFYDQYKSTFWWFFIPFIIYLFAKGAFIALATGNGLVQSAGQIGCEVFLLIFLVIGRPYNTTSGNVINICISVARVISVVGVLVFTVELRVEATTKTVTGLVLIVVQSVVTAALAILIAVNAIVICCKENPHVRKRRAAEKAAEEARARDTLTPLDARNSIINPVSYRPNFDGKGKYQSTPTTDHFPMNDYSSTASIAPPSFHSSPPRHPAQVGHYNPVYNPADEYMGYTGFAGGDRSVSPVDNRPGTNFVQQHQSQQSQDNLLARGAPMGRAPMTHFDSYDSYDHYRQGPPGPGQAF